MTVMTAPGPIMIGLQGLSLSDEEKELLLHPLVGGVILFTRNYQDKAQLCALTAAIRQQRATLLIGVDHEGGRVQRFRDGFTALPALSQLGKLYENDPSRALTLARSHAWLMATELRAVDIDLSFAPVLDLDRGLNTAIGNRAFHRDPAIVTELGLAYQTGMAQAGMISIAKHFPGHGGVTLDSHHELPVDTRSFATIEKEDLAPFAKLIEHNIAAIMPAHIIFSEIDERPAGFSPFWLGDILRQRLGFQGAVISDDMGMAGAAWAGAPAERASIAIDAGVDLILACNEREAAIAMLDGLPERRYPDCSGRLQKLRSQSAIPTNLNANADWLEIVHQIATLV